VRGAEQDAGPVRDKCLRRGKSETAAAAGYEVNPVAQSKIHPACRFSFLLSGLVRLTWAFVLVLIDLSGGLFSVICPFLRTGWPAP
jgi:hypothetical protein